MTVMSATPWFQPAMRSARSMPVARVSRPGVADTSVDASVWEACADRVLEISGGVALALIPFATLAWMFVAW